MKLLTCLQHWEKQRTTEARGAICRPYPERRHTTKMNKADIRELIDLWPVYPEVGWLRRHPGGRA